jgi:hypothetical protein
MKRSDAKRLALLTQIAEIKATRAKSVAATRMRHLHALETQRSEILQKKHEVQPGLLDPATAAQTARWMTGFETKMRELSAETARARVGAETARETARFEEGRRQVLSKLGDQAS